MLNLANDSHHNHTTPVQRYVFGLPQLLNLMFCAVSIPMTATVFVILLRNRHIFTDPFYIYILNVEVCFQLQSFIASPLFMYVSGYSHFPSGDQLCTFFLYVIYVLAPWEVFCQLLITTNRLWAMIFPASYHQNHNRRSAILVCILGCLAARLTLLPVVIIRAVLGPSIANQNYTCKLNIPGNAAVETAVRVTGVVFIIVETLVVLIYPLIFYKYRQNKRLVAAARMTSGGSRLSKRQTAGVFWTLTFCTISYVFFMLPAAFYLVVTSMSGKFSTEIFSVLYLLSSLQGIVDPIIFVTTLRALRKVCWRTISSYCSS